MNTGAALYSYFRRLFGQALQRRDWFEDQLEISRSMREIDEAITALALTDHDLAAFLNNAGGLAAHW